LQELAKSFQQNVIPNENNAKVQRVERTTETTSHDATDKTKSQTQVHERETRRNTPIQLNTEYTPNTPLTTQTKSSRVLRTRERTPSPEPPPVKSRGRMLTRRAKPLQNKPVNIIPPSSTAKSRHIAGQRSKQVNSRRVRIQTPSFHIFDKENITPDDIPTVTQEDEPDEEPPPCRRSQRLSQIAAMLTNLRNLMNVPIANAVVHPITKETITKYAKLIKDPDMIKNISKDRTITYVRIVVDVRPQKEDPNRVRVTAGGNLIFYPKELTTRTADLITTKVLWNSVLSTLNAKYACIDIKNMYLATPMERYEYMTIPVHLIPEEFM